MARPYSLDLSERVVASVAAGESCPFRKQCPRIAMMQARQNGRSGNLSVSLDRSTQRRILVAAISACAIYYSSRRTRSEFAAGAPSPKISIRSRHSRRNVPIRRSIAGTKQSKHCPDV